LLVAAWLRGARIAQERFLAGGVDRRAVGGEERFRLARGEGVAFDGLGEPSLLRGGEDRQSTRHREGQSAAIDARVQIRREAAREREAAVDPGGPLAQEFGDRGHGELVVHERGHDAGLVNGAGGLGRSVGLEKPRLHRRTLDRL
jgi:hypothetical protein